MSASNDQHKIDPASITNDSFLIELFGPLYPQCWVGCETNKAGGFAPKTRFLNPTTSCWFASAALKPGSTRRENPSFAAGVVFVLDDVGTKLPHEIAAQAPQPTYKIETSPGNYQWGYKIEPPEQDSKKWEALRKLLKDTKFSGGADGSGLANYVRLPHGGYHKDKHLPQDQRHRTNMTEWSPTVTYSLDELAKHLGVTLDEQTLETVRLSSQAAARVVADKELEQDPGYKMFDKLGWLLSNQKSNGWIDITCPNEAMHTDGESGAAYCVAAGTNRTPDFKCHHTHCAGLRWKSNSRRGIEEMFWNDEPYKQDYRAIVFPPLTKEELDSAESLSSEADKIKNKIIEANLLAEIRALLPDTAKGYIKKPLPNGQLDVVEYNPDDLSPPLMRPRIFDVFTRNMMVMVGAMPAVGKSLYTLNLAAAIAWETLTPLVPAPSEDAKPDWTGDVIIVSNEDDIHEVRLRLNALTGHYGLKKDTQKHKIHVIAHENVKVAGLDAKTNNVVPTHAPLLKEIIRILESPRKPQIAMVIIDTFASSVKNAPENATEIMQSVMEISKDLAAALFSCVVFVHHTSKAGAKDESPDVYTVLRGSTAIAGAVRGALALSKLRKAEDARKFGLTPAEADRCIRLDRVKANYMPDTGTALTAFKKVSVDMDVRDPRDGSTKQVSVGVLSPLAPLPETQLQKGDFEILCAKQRELDDAGLGERILPGNKGRAGTGRENWPTVSRLFGTTLPKATERLKKLIDDGVIKIADFDVGNGKRIDVVGFPVGTAPNIEAENDVSAAGVEYDDGEETGLEAF